MADFIKFIAVETDSPFLIGVEIITEVWQTPAPRICRLITARDEIEVHATIDEVAELIARADPVAEVRFEPDAAAVIDQYKEEKTPKPYGVSTATIEGQLR